MNWRRNKQKHPCGSLLLARQRMRNWYQTPFGQYLAQLEGSWVDSALSNVFGYHLIQLGYPGNGNLFPNSRISHRMILDSDYESLEIAEELSASVLGGVPEELPIASDSIDVVVLPHTLEYVSEPHQVLREVDRILIPEGHLVILGFNPWSLWWLWKGLLSWRHQPPWCGRFFSMLRVKDWMSLLGYDAVYTQHFFYRPPFKQIKLLSKLKFMEKLGKRFWPVMGGCYVLVAQKRQVTLTPIKPRWRPKRSFKPADVVETQSRRENCEKS